MGVVVVVVVVLYLSEHNSHSAPVCLSVFNRATVQRTQPRRAASAEKSRTSLPSAPTAAAEQRTRPASWPKRWSLLAFLREVEQWRGAARGRVLFPPLTMLLCRRKT